MAKPARTVKSGKTYIGFKCRKCGAPLPVAEDPSGNVRLGGPGKLRLACQKCGHSDEYEGAEAQHFSAHSLH